MSYPGQVPGAYPAQAPMMQGGQMVSEAATDRACITRHHRTQNAGYVTQQPMMQGYNGQPPAQQVV